ncbi:hypothetical protein [Citricoccus sp. I39-566]|uniref:hypothetical protein n=1 Tax=Citricoccus sp. I39-566 TaxID=3073268 RepID=UPI00286CF1EA|nr:hypothetical protein [Citricoccus sp. I39-566]WMY80070.1 hypothetical protein RE421_16470 [Citricoccus sp. I39-566]
MTTINEAVRAWAKGMYATEAGVELLIRSRVAIRDGAPWIHRDGDRAWVDPEELLNAAGAWSGGEQRLVRIAASLIGGPAVDLSEDIPALDRENASLVLAAIAHANGSHEHSDFSYNAEGRPNGIVSLDSLYPWPKAGR